MVISDSATRPVIHAVLFDLDGVLIDSMPHHVRAWQEEFAAWGVTIDPLIFRLREGEKAAATLAFAAQEYGLILTKEQALRFVESKRRRYRKTAPKQLVDGAADLLRTLRNSRIKTALVTGSIRRNLDHSISKDEQSLFDAIITADLCTHGKPHPEPYLRASEALNIPPNHCLAVENAPLGIQSARAAGAFVLALTSTLPAKYLKDADRIIDDLSDILHHDAYVLKAISPLRSRGEKKGG
jgi:beta-phosphoglucomutase